MVCLTAVFVHSCSIVVVISVVGIVTTTRHSRNSLAAYRSPCAFAVFTPRRNSVFISTTLGSVPIWVLIRSPVACWCRWWYGDSRFAAENIKTKACACRVRAATRLWAELKWKHFCVSYVLSHVYSSACSICIRAESDETKARTRKTVPTIYV